MHHRDPIRRGLVWGAVATLLLPIVLAVVLGLGGLLGGLGDAAGSRFCLRVALVVGAAWIVGVVATTALSAVAHLGHRPPCRQRRRGRRPEPGWRHGRRSPDPGPPSAPPGSPPG